MRNILMLVVQHNGSILSTPETSVCDTIQHHARTFFAHAQCADACGIAQWLNLTYLWDKRPQLSSAQVVGHEIELDSPLSRLRGDVFLLPRR